MSPALILALILAALVVLVAGFFGFRRLYRGPRVGDQPTCRACGFDLSGLDLANEDDPRCPECGADLTAANAVARGTPRRRPLLTAAVAGLVLLVAVWFGVTRTTIGAAALRHLPDRPLVTLVGVGSPAAASEIDRRLTAGTFDAAAADALADAAIERLAAGNLAADSVWEDLLITIVNTHPLSEAQRGGIVRAALGDGVTLRVRPTVEQGNDVPFQVVAQGGNVPSRLARPGGPFGLGVRLIEIRAGGQRSARPLGGQITSTGLPTGSMKIGTTGVFPDLPPGEHEAEVTIELTAEPVTSDPTLPIDERPDVWRTTLRAPLRVVAPGENAAPFVDTPAARERISSLIRVGPLDLPQAEQPFMVAIARLFVTLSDEPNPPIAARVLLRSPELGEIELGSFTQTSASMHTVEMSDHDPPELPFPTWDERWPETVDVLLVPDREIERTRLETDPIFGRTLVFRDVPIRRVADINSYSTDPDPPPVAPTFEDDTGSPSPD